ncbi:hypothetical protein LCGC14_0977470 [marine sediment metagenome]|uniref:Uncharacterized protein n=1 Tax=marine sediment metagenome TaxID=412755 RepID=A0A0F9QT84_9ZZZZ
MKSYDLSNWEELTEKQRDNVCSYQKLTQVFITEHWKELTNFQRNGVCLSQKLTQSFINKHWKELTEGQRYWVYQYQELSPSFKEQLMSGNIPKFIPTKTIRYIDMNFEDF